MGWTGNSSANWEMGWEMGYFKTISGKGWEMGRVKMGEHWAGVENVFSVAGHLTDTRATTMKDETFERKLFVTLTKKL